MLTPETAKEDFICRRDVKQINYSGIVNSHHVGKELDNYLFNLAIV